MLREGRLSPDALAALVDRCGVRSDWVPGGATRFSLRDCRAIARVGPAGGNSTLLEIDLVEIDIVGIDFEAGIRLVDGTPLLIELPVPGLPQPVWGCRVVSAAECSPGRKYRVRASFEGS